jgi:MFS family permease
MAIFELGSLLCATAVNSQMLIVGRAIAGIGAAGCFTGAFTIVASSMPLEKRPAYIGILQSTFGFATILGPVLGGALTQHVSWRFCFYINLPIGAVTIAFIAFFFKMPAQDSQEATSAWEKLAKLDLIGVMMFIPSIVMVLLAFQWGGIEHAWKSATIIGLVLGGGLFSCVFILWQIRKGDDAMIPPRIFKKRNVFASCLTEFFAMGAVYCSIYFLPEWFQVVKGASPTKSGVMYLPLSISDIISATLTGFGLRYIGYPNPLILLGTVLMSVGTGLFTTFEPTTSHQFWIPYQVLQGLGAGMTLSMPYVVIQTVLDAQDIAVGTSLLQCFQFLGAAMFLAIGQAVFSNQLKSSMTSSGIPAQDIQNIISAGSAGVRNITITPAEYVNDVINAYNSSIVHTFYVASAVAATAALISLCLQWKSIKSPRL